MNVLQTILSDQKVGAGKLTRLAEQARVLRAIDSDNILDDRARAFFEIWRENILYQAVLLMTLEWIDEQMLANIQKDIQEYLM